MRIDALDANLGIVLPVQGLSSPQHWDQLAQLLAAGAEVMGPTGRTWQLDPVELARQLNLQPAASPVRYASGGRGIDLHAVTKLLRLGENKLRVLKLLHRADWIKILHLLPKELLINALRLFSKSRLLRLIMMLPKRLLIKMLLRVFKLEDLIRKMPTRELMRILRSGRLNNRELVKGLQQMDPKFVTLLLQRIYGNYDYSKLKPSEIARIFMHTNKERLMEAFKTLPFKALTPFVLGFVKRDPELLMNMSDAFIFKLMDRLPKPVLMDACTVLPPELIIKMLTQLPNPLLMLAAAQIDEKTLGQYLVSQQPALLRALAGAA